MGCFLCAKKAIRKYSTIARVKTFPLVKTLITCYLNRGNIWGNEEYTRLLSCNGSRGRNLPHFLHELHPVSEKYQ